MASQSPNNPEDLNTVTELWSLINVGDEIQLEADLLGGGKAVLLEAGHFYPVLAKTNTQGSAHFDAFIVESNLTSQLVAVSPAFVSNYQINPDTHFA